MRALVGPALEPRSAEGLIPVEKLPAVGIGRSYSPDNSNRSPEQRAMHHHLSRDTVAHQYRRRIAVDVTALLHDQFFVFAKIFVATYVGLWEIA